VAPLAAAASYSGVARGRRRLRGQLREVGIAEGAEWRGKDKVGEKGDDVWVSCVNVWWLGFEEEEIESLGIIDVQMVRWAARH
jgi:hypothetical protein